MESKLSMNGRDKLSVASCKISLTGSTGLGDLDENNGSCSRLSNDGMDDDAGTGLRMTSDLTISDEERGTTDDDDMLDSATVAETTVSLEVSARTLVDVDANLGLGEVKSSMIVNSSSLAPDPLMVALLVDEDD